MNKISKRSIVLYALVVAFIVGACFLIVTMFSNASDWAMKRANKHIYSNDHIIAAGAIYDRNGVTLSKTEGTKRVYNEDANIRKSTIHAVGDPGGYIATGAQNAFQSDLTGYSIINGVSKIKDEGVSHDIHLTIDANLCAKAYNHLGKHDGVVGVLNYETGEIVCMVSKPTFDINNQPSDEEVKNNPKKYEGIYINKFLSGRYTPGSTFKVVTAASAIENIPDIDSQTFHCNGSFKTSTGVVRCHSVHGSLNFEKALNRSCNSAFADIAEQLGNRNLTQTAERMGYNKTITIDGVKTLKSYFTLDNAVSVDRGWAGIGQYKTLTNPCHALTIMGAIASKGSCPPLHLLSKNDQGYGIGETSLKYLDASTANKLKGMLRSNVKNFYGDRKFPGLEMCGKTGTAEMKNQKDTTWFVGFSLNPETPYAIVVVLENSGGYGITVAAPIANKVMQDVVKAK